MKYGWRMAAAESIEVGGGIIWSPADYVRLPTDKEMIRL